MLNKTLFMMFLLSAGSALLMGAWPGSSASPAKLTRSAFVAQALELETDIVGSDLSASELLEKALARLEPDHVSWLKTKIRQTMADGRTSFVADGFLQRGPRNCAHLKMDVLTNGQCATLLIISDGNLIAEVKKIPHRPAFERVTHLQPEDTSTQPTAPPVNEASLNARGCGGPTALLEQLCEHLQTSTPQTGLLQGRPVIRIKGEVQAGKPPVLVGTAIPVQAVAVYLDAKTLWPVQFEWWGEDKGQTLRPLLQIEFQDPELNQELSLEECVRMFSYHPEGNVGTVEVE